MSDLPPCGIYVTTAAIGGIPEARLVYFHNHGDPGPGLYLPASWKGNRCVFQGRGHLLPEPGDVRYLEPLAAEGFYRVASPFFCCDKRCRRFEAETLVQLGYNGSGAAILFLPEWVDGQLAIPDRGTHIERERVASLTPLKVAITEPQVHEDGADDRLLH